jgi:16S rRNA (guanine(1405)-N(7))-methyltransferase
MNLCEGSVYLPIDTDCELISTVNLFLQTVGREASGLCRDILSSHIEGRYDVALLLKSLPILRQQDPKTVIDLLTSIPAKRLVLSFPTRSIGGRAKGMEANYTSLMRELSVKGRGLPVKLSFPSEMVFIL